MWIESWRLNEIFLNVFSQLAPVQQFEIKRRKSDRLIANLLQAIKLQYKALKGFGTYKKMLDLPLSLNKPDDQSNFDRNLLAFYNNN